jgi:hypothetical protein
MSFDHKAFVFDYEAFANQLSGILKDALANSDIGALKGFIEDNKEFLKDPYEGEPLDDSWETMIETPDAHQYGDFALTKFYNPSDDIGLGDDWERLEQLLEAETGKGAMVLGTPFGPPGETFDPGKMGAYFQTEDEAQAHLQMLKNLLKEKPKLSDSLSAFIKMLEQAVEQKKGLYVAF